MANLARIALVIFSLAWTRAVAILIFILLNSNFSLSRTDSLSMSSFTCLPMYLSKLNVIHDYCSDG